MKKAIVVGLLLMVAVLGFAELSPEARAIRSTFPEGFAFIMETAEADWPGDYAMQTYAVNRQSEAFFEAMDIMTADGGFDDNIMIQAMLDWSEFSTFATMSAGMKAGGTLGARCDWTMVVYQYKLQFDAKKGLR